MYSYQLQCLLLVLKMKPPIFNVHVRFYTCIIIRVIRLACTWLYFWLDWSKCKYLWCTWNGACFRLQVYRRVEISCSINKLCRIRVVKTATVNYKNRELDCISPILNIFITRNWSALCQCLCMADAERLNYYFHWCAFCEYKFVFSHWSFFFFSFDIGTNCQWVLIQFLFSFREYFSRESYGQFTGLAWWSLWCVF